MSKPLTITIPHRLTQEQARERIQRGVAGFRSQFAGQIANVEDHWTGNHLDFRFTALGQAVNGRLDVEPQSITLNVDLPWLLAALADKLRPAIRREAGKLLEHE